MSNRRETSWIHKFIEYREFILIIFLAGGCYYKLNETEVQLNSLTQEVKQMQFQIQDSKIQSAKYGEQINNLIDMVNWMRARWND